MTTRNETPPHFPAAQIRRTQSLNGTWELTPGNERLPSRFAYRVQVPALVDLADPPYDWATHHFHWYRRTFSDPRRSPTEQCVVRFDQSQFGTEVFINGQRVGGTISCYTSHSWRIDSFLHPGAENELVVRVGAKDTLPPESAVGHDQERDSFIPGIWGDVLLFTCGPVRIVNLQVLPRIDSDSAEIRVQVENSGDAPVETRIAVDVRENVNRRAAGRAAKVAECPPGIARVTLNVPIDRMKLWSPDSPFLYDCIATASVGSLPSDEVNARFGMREFSIDGGDFLLNGKKILLRGGNIVFHRFLSDPDRKLLPWNKEWIHKVLVTIPRDHNFNCFRAHIGQMYNRWYDIADEAGILIQNEWPFWTVSGTKEQAISEFSDWLSDNWNHPSIVIWDALNECSDPVVEKEIIPLMKQLDPTRPWEPVDFREQHPYIYSLGMVLNDRPFGFADSLDALRTSATPAVVNEFLWWWLDAENRPTALMKGVVERWLGPKCTTDEIVAHQGFLAAELVELFRRLGADAIQPFVYLSNGTGATGHWFLGNIADARPKPLLKVLKNAFSPFGVSIELWDRHFFAGERRDVRVFVFNDRSEMRKGTLTVGIAEKEGLDVTSASLEIEVDQTSLRIVDIPLDFAPAPGSYTVRALLHSNEEGGQPASSVKPVLVYENLKRIEGGSRKHLATFDETGEIGSYLAELGFEILHEFRAAPASSLPVLVHLRSYESKEFDQFRSLIDAHVRGGAMMALIEPEFGVEGEHTAEIFDGLRFTVRKRADIDKGGYDSHVFIEDTAHPLWRGIGDVDLKFFNGTLGGEIVSQHDLDIDRPHTVLARCGLGLKVIAAAEIPYGKGRVVILRTQLRGRLMKGTQRRGLFDRRPDPVCQRLLLNLASLRP